MMQSNVPARLTQRSVPTPNGAPSTDRYRQVFTPMRIGPVEVPNRFYIPPHGIGPASHGPASDGSVVPTADAGYYFVERIDAGVGLVMHSLTTRFRDLAPSPLLPHSVPYFKVVSDMVHEHGGRIFGQIHNYGGRHVAWQPGGAMAPIIGPSGYQRYGANDTVHAMTLKEIEYLVKAYGQCACHLRLAGYDGVEIHCAHGMLIEHFLSPYYNQRADRYGGSQENRMRLLVEILTLAREMVGAELALGMRFNCDEMLPGGLTQDDTKSVLAELLPMRLLDFVDLDTSVEPEQALVMTTPAWTQPLMNVPFIENVGQVARGKIVVMGNPTRLTSLQQAESLLAAGTVDMVGAVRAFLAEPELIKNAREGREDRNRICIASNFCRSAGRLRTGAGCVLNPASYREREWGVKSLRPQGRSARVVVAGAGPAGLEAARVAALLGHSVVVFERQPSIGGQLRLWASLPGRGNLNSTIHWYEGRLRELEVDLRCGTEATTAAVLAEKPEAVLVAMGAAYDRTGKTGFVNLPIAGADHDIVYSPEAILADGQRPLGSVLILDEESWHTAAGIAEILASAGAQVEIVTRHPEPLNSLYHEDEYKYVLPRLHKLNARLTTLTYVKEIGNHEVVLYNVITGEQERRRVDAIVLATMRNPVSWLLTELDGKVRQLFTIGDSSAPRGLFEATYEGQRFARLVAVEGAPRDMAEAIFGTPQQHSAEQT